MRAQHWKHLALLFLSVALLGARCDPFGLTADDDQYEPNNSRVDAYPINSDTWLTARQYDDDWFRIEVPSDELGLTIELRFLHSAGDINVALVSSSGTALGSATSTTDNELLNRELSSSGTYYIRVYYGDEGNEYDLMWYSEQVSGPSGGIDVGIE